MTTTFHKKSRSNFYNIPGTRLSLKSSELLVSSGVPSLDSILGGGFPVGSIVVVEEDKYSTYSTQLLKYHLSEGLVHGHCVYVASGETPPWKLLKELPKVVHNNGESCSPAGDQDRNRVSDNEMKIAFRYHNIPAHQSVVPTQSPHSFDFGEKIDADALERADITTFDPSDFHETTAMSDQDNVLGHTYSCLFQSICDSVKKTKENQVDDKKNITRIALKGIGSTIWGSTDSVQKFMYFLKAVARQEFLVVMVTLPSFVTKDEILIRRIKNHADIVIRLQAFDGFERETNPLYKNFHGLLHLAKLPRIKTLNAHMPDSLDYLFHQRSKKFVIEKLHMPPDVGNDDKEKDIFKKEPRILTCSGPRSLDF